MAQSRETSIFKINTLLICFLCIILFLFSVIVSIHRYLTLLQWNHTWPLVTFMSPRLQKCWMSSSSGPDHRATGVKCGKKWKNGDQTGLHRPLILFSYRDHPLQHGILETAGDDYLGGGANQCKCQPTYMVLFRQVGRRVFMLNLSSTPL